MKKFWKRFLLFFCLPIAILATIVFAPAAFIRYCMPERFDYQDHTAHFNIYYNETEKLAIADIENYLESNYNRVTTDLKQQMEKPTTIKIYPELSALHSTLKLRRSLGNGLTWWIHLLLDGEIESWRVGETDGTTGEIRIVSPLNSGENGYDGVLSISVHEFTHAVANKIAPNTLGRTAFGEFLNEGIANYEAGYYESNNRNGDLLKVLPNSIDELPSSNGLAYVGGYSLVKYIVENYGYDKIIELLKKDYLYNGYDNDTRALYNEWLEYLKANQN